MYGQNPYSQYPYTGYGYPNYGNRQFMQPQQQQMVQQQQQMQMQPQQQQPIQYEAPIQDIRFVTSEEAKAFIVMPNSKVLLIDKNGGMAHLKSADNMGQSFTSCFKFEQVNADGTPIKKQEPAEEIDYKQFLKKQDLANLGFVTIDQYNALVTEIKRLQNQITGVKPNGTAQTANTANTTNTASRQQQHQ